MFLRIGSKEKLVPLEELSRSCLRAVWELGAVEGLERSKKRPRSQKKSAEDLPIWGVKKGGVTK